ncbi:ATP-dependent RNA helicase HelY [Rhodococcus pyridinivorans]|uniref:DEAD/DEAH box helicase n=1 Tax=Rhodococcus pyridinivorans TaxID=103816 RepID=UPI0007CD6855|nr:DEAD/DEAH box helicase [Rhodococcus pyridinivorans]SED66539.1 ATP-dependent RNA helicase HelY [Rhodococcus pyridinivorans]
MRTQDRSQLALFATELDFPLDDFQVEACRALEDDRDVLVCAPTGAGKTVVGEFAARLALAAGGRCFYTTPIKALSNQKYFDLSRRFGDDRVGLLTGDISLDPRAPVVVMTTEVLRSMLHGGSPLLHGLTHVVMDEVHYLADRERGAVWEEAILSLPDDVRLTSLSATVSNAEEFGGWLRGVRGDLAVVVEETRPVPLTQHMLAGGRLFDLLSPSGTVDETLERYIAHRQLVEAAPGPATGRGRRRRRARGAPGPAGADLPEVVARLEAEQLLPAIWFRFSRNGCDGAVAECLESSVRLTEAADVAEIRAVADRHTAALPPADLDAVGHAEWLEGLERGFAAHHAGLIPAFRHTVEELFARGLVRVVFATETLAVGVNMPARTVVLERLVKPTADGPVRLSPGEYTQLTGRAGRRGIDVEGHAVVLWSPEAAPAAVAGLAGARSYPLHSSLRVGYNTAVNLVAGRGIPGSREFLRRSFAQFQAERSVAALTDAVRANTTALRDLDTELGDAEGFTEYRHLCDRLAEARRSGSAELVTSLARAVRSHPAHRRGDRERLLALSARRAAVHGDTERMRSQIDTVTGRLVETFDRTLDLLEERGYLLRDPMGGSAYVTDDGRRLGRIYCANDLLVAECVRTGAWSGLTPAELAAVASSALGETRRRTVGVPGRTTPAIDEALRATSRLWSELAGREERLGLEVGPDPDPIAVAAIHRWARGDGLAAALRTASDAGLSAGDLVRRYLRTLDLVDQTGLCRRDDLPPVSFTLT